MGVYREYAVGDSSKTQQAGYSAHAAARMQQRGIREDLVDLLLRYGREEHDHRGGTIIYFDKVARARMARDAHRPLPALPGKQRRASLSEIYAALPRRQRKASLLESYAALPRQRGMGVLNSRIYAVLGRSGEIVTVGHRYARIWRH